jgi:hypothetical protein
MVSTAIVGSGRDDKRLRAFINSLVLQMTGVDLESFELDGQIRGLWGHIEVTQQKRNAILHRAESVELRDAEQTIALATLIVMRLFPLLRQKMELLA